MHIEPSRRHMIALWVILVVIQINDVFVHWAFAQLELTRVIANIILLIGALIAYWRVSRYYLLGGFGIYVFANLAFLFHEGWFNDHDTLRYPLIVFVAFTAWITALLDKLFLKGLIKHKAPRH